jgi:hypothetical protein
VGKGKFQRTKKATKVIPSSRCEGVKKNIVKEERKD